MTQVRRGSAVGVAAGLAALATVLSGCTGPSPGPAARPSDPGTPLASYDTTAVALTRAPYCDRVPEAATEEALGAAPRASSTYDNGDRVKVGGSKDVVHEYGCAWSVGDTRARTWLLAPPVTGERARDLLDQARRPEGCVPDAQAPAFGTPSVALVCTGKAAVSASYRGLFGNAWLVCEIETRDGTTEDGALLQRTGHWCVQVLEAARTGSAE